MHEASKIAGVARETRNGRHPLQAHCYTCCELQELDKISIFSGR